MKKIAAAGLRVLEEYKSGLYLPGIAECMGEKGSMFEQLLEQRVRDTGWDLIF